MESYYKKIKEINREKNGRQRILTRKKKKSFYRADKNLGQTYCHKLKNKKLNKTTMFIKQELISNIQELGGRNCKTIGNEI